MNETLNYNRTKEFFEYYQKMISGSKMYDLTEITPDKVYLEAQEVIAPDNRRYSFEIDGFRKYCLLNGLDDIGLTLKNADKIKAFEAERVLRMPWLATQLP